MRLKYCLLLLCLIFTKQIVLSQLKTIKGNVRDKQTQTALSYANVFLQKNMNKGSISNEDGEFSLPISDQDLNDSIVISFIGYKEEKIAVSDMNNHSDTVLLEPYTKQIDEASITVKKIISEEFVIKKIDQLDIYINPLSKADPLLAVNGMAASTTIDESANISLRGSSPEETGIFFNGVPIYDAVRFSQMNGIGTFSIFNTSIVDKMLVFPSNPPIECGNATSGMVSIFTDDQLPLSNSNYITLSNVV